MGDVTAQSWTGRGKQWHVLWCDVTLPGQDGQNIIRTREVKGRRVVLFRASAGSPWRLARQGGRNVLEGEQTRRESWVVRV